MVCLHPVSWRNGGFWPNLHSCIIGTCQRTDYILVALASFSRWHMGLDCWKMACLHSISWMIGWILTKLVHLYCCDMEKNWLDFGDLDQFSRSHNGLDCWKMACLENGLSALYLMKEWMNFDQTCTALALLLWHGKELIRFCLPWPHFNVTGGFRLLENALSAPCLLNEWMGFDQTCTAVLLRQGQELVRFWWPWPYFHGHTRA